MHDTSARSTVVQSSVKNLHTHHRLFNLRVQSNDAAARTTTAAAAAARISSAAAYTKSHTNDNKTFRFIVRNIVRDSQR